MHHTSAHQATSGRWKAATGLSPGRGANYLFVRGIKYYYRRRIPNELQPCFGGKTEIRRSLGTTDREKAVRRVREVDREVLREFDRCRAELAAGKAGERCRVRIEPVVIDALCLLFQRRVRERERIERREHAAQGTLAALCRTYAQELQAMRRALAAWELPAVEPLLNDFIEELGLVLEGAVLQRSHQDAWEVLRSEFLRAVVAVYTDRARACEGEVAPLPPPPAPAVARVAEGLNGVRTGAPVTLARAWADWRAQRTDHNAPRPAGTARRPGASSPRR